MSKKTLSMLERRYEDAHQYWSNIYTEFEGLEYLYWGLPRPEKSKQNHPWRSQVVDNIVFEAVEKMVSHSYGGNPRGRFVGVEPGDDLGAIVNNTLFDWQWRYKGQNMNLKLRNMGLQQMLFGIAFGVLDWKYETRKRKRREIIDSETFEEIEEEIVVCDNWNFKPLYIFDCYPDPAATCVEDMEYFIYEEWVSLRQLKARNSGKFKPYSNLGKVEEKLKKIDASEGDFGNNVNDLRGLETGKNKKRIRVRRMITRDKFYSYLPDIKEVIEDRDNPYWHGDLNVHMIVDYSYPNQLFGRGEVEPIKTQQLALNAIVNQRLDNVELVLNAGWKAKAGSKYAHTWKMRPGWVALVEDINDLEPMSIPDVTSRTFIETTNYFKDSVSRVLGHTDFTSRNESVNEKTATEIRAAMGEQNVRIKDKEKYIDTFMERLAGQILELNQQFVSADKTIRVVGSDAQKYLQQKQKFEEGQGTVGGIGYTQQGDLGYLTVTPQRLEGRYDYIVESGSLSEVDPQAKAGSVMLAIKTLRENEQQLMANSKKVNYEPLLEKMLRLLEIKNIDEVFEQITEQQMAQQQMGMQQQQQFGRGRRLQPSVF